MELNNLIDQFIDLYKNNSKQHNEDWYKLMGNTVGGSEIASLLGLSPYSSFYKVVESKIKICKGENINNGSVSCWWGTLFEKIIAQVIEIDLGNKVKGTDICIQEYEGHRNSPDGYTAVNLYKKDNMYHIWTTDLDPDIIELQIIVLLEFKCPLTRSVGNNIPVWYKPQVLSGLDVSPVASKGLYIDACFRKCSIKQLGNNPLYDFNFHKKNNKEVMPIAWGIILFQSQDNIDLGSISNDLFNNYMELIANEKLIIKSCSITFADGRSTQSSTQSSTPESGIYLPWKLFDLLYMPIDREPNYITNLMPIIQKVHTLVKENISNNIAPEILKIIDLCESIYE